MKRIITITKVADKNLQLFNKQIGHLAAHAYLPWMLAFNAISKLINQIGNTYELNNCQ